VNDALSRALTEAETSLRAHGLTGGQAFDALLAGLEFRLGTGTRPSAAVQEVAASVPLEPGSDLFGLAYERFFPDLFKGLRGQFFTPPPVARLLVDVVGPRANEVVLDPTCGSGGLLIAAARHGAVPRGIDIDARLVRLASLNLRLTGHADAVACADFFLADPEPVDVVVANPPFSVPIRDRARLDRFTLGRERTTVASDHLFVEALERWVRPGGRAALVLPFSILTNRSARALRERVDLHWHRLAICALPEGVFRPFGGAAGRAALLWLERRGKTRASRPCRWATLTDPGYDVRASRVKLTSSAEVDGLIAGQGWRVLPDGAWTAAGEGTGSRTVGSLARVRHQRPVSRGPVEVADLADADRALGELHPRAEPKPPPGRVVLRPGDVVVARLRPNLGNVARVPDGAGPLVGSPEWLVLEPIGCGPYLLHALRTPAWRGSLPVTGGQTRPRTTTEAVLASSVAWPGESLAERIGRLSSRWFAERAALRAKVEALQAAVDGFAAGDLDQEALTSAVERLEASEGDRSAGQGLASGAADRRKRR
jgi:N-6 DNA Methylase